MLRPDYYDATDPTGPRDYFRSRVPSCYWQLESLNRDNIALNLGWSYTINKTQYIAGIFNFEF